MNSRLGKQHTDYVAGIRALKSQPLVRAAVTTRLEAYEELRTKLIEEHYDPESVALAEQIKVLPMLFKLVHSSRAPSLTNALTNAFPYRHTDIGRCWG